MKTEYRKTAHRIYSLRAHIVLCTKYRKRILQDEIDEEVKKILISNCTYWGCEVGAIETDLDHVHILISYDINQRIDKIVTSIKMNSTKMLWKTFDSTLSKVYWRERTLWSDGAFICSTGGAATDVIKDYINNQKQ